MRTLKFTQCKPFTNHSDHRPLQAFFHFKPYPLTIPKHSTNTDKLLLKRETIIQKEQETKHLDKQLQHITKSTHVHPILDTAITIFIRKYHLKKKPPKHTRQPILSRDKHI